VAAGARVGAASVVALLIGSCAPGTTTPTRAPTASVSSAEGTTAQPLSGQVGPDAWRAERTAAADALVRGLARAAEAGDTTAWLAPLAGAPGSALAVRQAAVLRRMVAMRVTDVNVTDVRERTQPASTRVGRPVDWGVRAALTYRLDGFDSAPRTFELDLTLRADPARPDRVELVASEPGDRPQPWDLDGLTVRRTTDTLVLGVGPASRVDEVLRRAQDARRWVGAVWGRVPPAVWVAPRTDADAARLLGRSPTGLEGVAAATDGPLEPGRNAGADRIVVVPGAWQSVRPAGRDVVMAHELTHVAVRSSTTREVPLWLAEGFAELVAWRSVDLPERSIVADALDAVRSDGIPSGLPTDEDFDPATGSLPVAYGFGLLAVRTLADRYGTDAVVRLYRDAAGGLDVPTDSLGDPEAVIDRALAEVLHTDREHVVRAWQARLRALTR
jgi:hypothetical protein